MKKHFLIAGIFLGFASLLGAVFVFAAASPMPPVVSPKVPLYQDTSPTNTYYCISDDDRDDDAVNINQLMYHTDEPEDLFPYFDDGVYVVENKTKLSYYAPMGSAGFDHFTLDVDGINVLPNTVPSSKPKACNVSRLPLSFAITPTSLTDNWVYVNNQLYSSQGLGLPLQSTPLVDENNNITSYFIGGYNISLTPAPANALYSVTVGGMGATKEKIALYATQKVLPGETTAYLAQKVVRREGFVGPKGANDEDIGANGLTYRIRRDVTMSGMPPTCSETIHVLVETIDPQKDIDDTWNPSDYVVERAVKAGSNIAVILSNGSDMYYQVFEQNSAFPTNPGLPPGFIPGNFPTPSCSASSTVVQDWPTGQYNNPSYKTGEYYTAVTPAPLSLSISSRGNFDFQYITLGGTPYLMLVGGINNDTGVDLKDILFFPVNVSGRTLGTPVTYPLPAGIGGESVKMIIDTVAQKAFLFGGGSGDAYFLLENVNRVSDFCKTGLATGCTGEDWKKISFSRTNTLPSTGADGIPAKTKWENGINVVYQPYDKAQIGRFSLLNINTGIAPFQPLKLHFTTDITEVQPEVHVRVYRCGRFRPPCFEDAPMWMRGETKIPVTLASDNNAIKDTGISGNNRVFTGGKITTSVTPLVSLNRDNTVSFVGNVKVVDPTTNPREDLRLNSVYFIEEGEKIPLPPVKFQDTPPATPPFSFTGFTSDFFNTFLRARPVDVQDKIKGISKVEISTGTKIETRYDDSDGSFSSTVVNNGVASNQNTCPYCQFARFAFQYDLPSKFQATTYKADGSPTEAKFPDGETAALNNLSFSFQKQFAPGPHRIHMLVTATHSRSMLEKKVRSNLLRGLDGVPLKKGAGKWSPAEWGTPATTLTGWLSTPMTHGLRSLTATGTHRSQPMTAAEMQLTGGVFPGPFKVYYQAYTIDFVVPEITNFSSEVDDTAIPSTEISAWNLTPAERALLPSLLNNDNKFIDKTIEELRGNDVLKSLTPTRIKDVFKLWYDHHPIKSNPISAIHPVFSLKNGLAYNSVNFFTGGYENDVKNAAIGMTEGVRMSVLAPLNDFALQMPVLDSKTIGTDANIKNLDIQNTHTNKAFFMRTGQDGTLNYASQTPFYPLAPSDKPYQVFATVTDEQGNVIGAPPVAFTVQKDETTTVNGVTSTADNGVFHVYETYPNFLRAGWKPFGLLELVHGDDHHFVMADRYGNISALFDRSDAVSVHNIGDQGPPVDIQFIKTDDLDRGKQWKDSKISLQNKVKEYSYNSADGKLLSPENPSLIPRITNYTDGDMVYSSQPIFEGTAIAGKPVFYRIYYRTKDPDPLITDKLFKEQEETTDANSHRQYIEKGVTQADGTGYFAFMPTGKYLTASPSPTNIYYVEVSTNSSDIEKIIWPDSSMISVRYQKSAFDSTTQVLLDGDPAKGEDRIERFGGYYEFSLYTGTPVRFTTPARLTLKAGQMLSLPPHAAMLIASTGAFDTQGKMFYLPQGSQVLDFSTGITRETDSGVYSKIVDGTMKGLLKDDEVIAPLHGGLLVVMSDSVDVIVPSGTQVLMEKLGNQTPSDSFKFTASRITPDEYKTRYPNFLFADTRFSFTNGKSDFPQFESLNQADCANYQSLLDQVKKDGSDVYSKVQRCQMISESLFPDTRDPKLFFPHNGEILDQSTKIELMGIAWPQSVLQIIIDSRHVGSVTTDKNGRFYWQAPQIFDFQQSGTAFEKMRKNGIEINLFDLEQDTRRVSVMVSFQSPGKKLDDIKTGSSVTVDIGIAKPDQATLKKQFLAEMKKPEAFDFIGMVKSFASRVRHFFTMQF